jgi:hypothetical protein
MFTVNRFYSSYAVAEERTYLPHTQLDCHLYYLYKIQDCEIHLLLPRIITYQFLLVSDTAISLSS